MAKVDILIIKRDYMGVRWVYSHSVTWEAYQAQAQRMPGEGESWKAKLVY